PALLGGFATVLLVDAFISPGATGYVYLGTSARTVYGLTMNGYFPDALKWIVSRFRIPWLALIVSFVGGCIFFLPLPSWYELVGIITSATVLTYIMGPIGLPAFRNLAPNLHRPFKLPYAEIVGPAGFIGAVLIVYWSGFTTLAIVVAAVFVALPVFVWFYAPNKGWISPAAGWILGIVFLALWLIVQRWGQWALVAKPTTVAHPQFAVFYFVSILMVAGFTGIFYYLCNDEGKIAVRASWWLIYFILAVYAISYYGVFGPLKTPGIPFPVDLLMVMMVALTAYGWAVMSAYQTEELKEILDSGSGLVQDDAPTRAAPTTPPPSISPQPGFGD
ncbi:MAG: APC family permease, partial [Acidimicrobiales bacterium]